MVSGALSEVAGVDRRVPVRRPRRTLPEGFTVIYDHERPYVVGNMLVVGFRVNGQQPLPRGGCTVATILDADRNLVAFGEATCHERDNYNRRIGRMIALGRALKNLETNG